MDLKIHRPQAVCSLSGRPFVAGEPIYSALVRGGSGLERIDVAADAWSGPPERTLAWWRSAFPATPTVGAVLAPPDVLLDVLEELEGRQEDEPLRFLLALQLVRRRILRIVDDAPGGPTGDELLLACRKRDREYRVRAVSAEEAAADGLEARLSALLWSGEAA
ncbi:MAG: hypothetical protein ACK6CT_00890 [Planctomycetia bacterium]|jgi:hypothetical protein